MPNRIEYREGDRMGNFIYLHDVPSVTHIRRAMFKCECGKEHESYITNIKKINSCGCKGYVNCKHGLTNHPIYRKWAQTKSRCYYKEAINYYYYGGRGIIMCDEWKDDFKAFYDYVTQLPDYSEKGMTLDRINNNGNYEPGNIRWTTKTEQCLNQRPRYNKTGFTGVYKNGENFIAAITVNKKYIYIGHFKTTEEAAMARNRFIINNNLHNYKLQLI